MRKYLSIQIMRKSNGLVKDLNAVTKLMIPTMIC